jgi:hypothetical protein
MQKVKNVKLVLCALVLTGGFASADQLFVNPGFENGDLTGWAVGGNSVSSGVGTDGTNIAAADPIFQPDQINVRSGNFAAFAVVRCGLSACTQSTTESITLTQTVGIVPFTSYNVGFYLGNDSSNGFGMEISDAYTQIFVNGVGILPSTPYLDSPLGSTSADFMLFSGTFNAGAATNATVTFQVTGSGTSRVGLSLDDLFFTGQAPATVPEPGTSALLTGGGLVSIFWTWRKRRSDA